MAIGNNLATAYLELTTSLPGSGVITACGWSLCTSPTSGADWHSLFFMEDATNDFQLAFRNTDGVLVIDTSGAAAVGFSASPTAGQRFFWWITHAGAGAGNLIGGWALPGANTFTTANMAGKSITPTSMWMLGDPYGQQNDGSHSDVKLWTAVLTQAELLNEMYSMLPVRLANLYDYWPLWRVGATEGYYNGHNWTEVGTLYTDRSAPFGGFVFPSEVSKPTTTTLTGSGALLSADGTVASSGSPTLIGDGALTSSTGTIAASGYTDMTGTGALTSSTGTVAASGSTTVAGTAALGSSSGTIAASDSVFPLAAHASGRYLVDSTGTPWRPHGDSAWALMMEVDSAGVNTYLDDREARGINLLKLQASIPDEFWTGGSSPASLGASGALPFLLNVSGTTWTAVWANHDAAFDSPNDDYWDWVDEVIRRAAQRGIAIIIDPMYWGFNFGASGGWWQTFAQAHNTQSVCFGFGQYLGARWASHKNLILNLGTDMFPTSASESSARARKIIEGLQDAGCTQLVTAHYKRSSTSDDYADYADLITFRSVYPGIGSGGSHAATYGRALVAYDQAPTQPMSAVEQIYEGEPESPSTPRTRQQIRSYSWWPAMCTAWPVFGNRDVELFRVDWEDFLNSNGMQDFEHLGAFFDAIEWWLLEPRDDLVTAGGGGNQTPAATPGNNDGTDGLDHVSVAMASDGSVLVAYVPHAHSGAVTLDMSELASAVRARWYDPTNASYTAIANYPASGTQAFTTTGNNADGTADWALILDLLDTDTGTVAITSSGGTLAAEGTSTVTGSCGMGSSGGTVAASGTMTVTGDGALTNGGGTLDARESEYSGQDDMFLIQ